MNWLKSLKGKVRFAEPLARYTTFRIGGPAKYLIEPKDTNDLKLLLNAGKTYKIPILVLGGGSNILIADKGVNCVAVRLNSPFFKKVIFQKNCVEAASGVRLSQLIRLGESRGLSGLEFLAGIPGTLGGALAMNAGAWGKSIAQSVEAIKLIDAHGKIKMLNPKEIKFGYRRSGLERYIILGARLKLAKRKRREINNRIERFIKKRREAQDLSSPSAGCIFKNPKGNSAGRLIDLCGLKGRKIGGAMISAKHANFILNLGRAKAGDVLGLMALAKSAVKKKFGITLEPEIKIWN